MSTIKLKEQLLVEKKNGNIEGIPLKLVGIAPFYLKIL